MPARDTGCASRGEGSANPAGKARPSARHISLTARGRLYGRRSARGRAERALAAVPGG